MFPGGLECFQVAWKISMYPKNFPGGKFPDGLESFPGGLESFHGGLKSFQVALKVSTVAWKVSMVAWKVSRWVESFHGGTENHTSKVSIRHLHLPQ